MLLSSDNQETKRRKKGFWASLTPFGITVALTLVAVLLSLVYIVIVAMSKQGYLTTLA